MNRFFTLLLAASCLTAVGQITYPYNPDGNADSLIGASDLQDILSTYGGAFSPSEILVGDSTLSFWIHHLSEKVFTQQTTIDSLLELQTMETEIVGFQVDYEYDGTNPINGFFVPDSVDFLMPQPIDLYVNRYVISRDRKPITVIGLESFGILNDTLCYFELVAPLPGSVWNNNNNWQTKAHTLFPLFDNWFVK